MTRALAFGVLLLLGACGAKEESPAADQQTVQQGIDQSVADVQAAERAARQQNSSR